MKTSTMLNALLKKHSFFFLIILSFFLQACSTVTTYNPLPKNLESHAEVPGFPGVRAWGDVHSDDLEKSAVESINQERKANHGKLGTEVNALALSGGGADGAFGAGIVYGWSKAKKMPKFKIVTGISTGALIAPFAFLSPRYDEKMKTVYTSMSDKDIYSQYSLFTIALAFMHIKELSSLADSKPLAQLIAKVVDEKMLREIAAEHRKGRRLLIGTTQLDAQRLVIWDMGQIANSRRKNALALFRKILLSSASIPVSFPPQYFDVVADGKNYKEMHVDGGVEAQTMLLESALYPFSSLGAVLKGTPRHRTMYIIRNDKVKPVWEDVKPQLKYIALRSISSLIRSQGIGDFYRLYAYSQRFDIDYNLAYIPPAFNVEAKSEFDQYYMTKLFGFASKLGSSDIAWHKYPPGFEPTTA
ncbi:MAG: hypothetical protein ACD_46C00585G0003 [uncultured bacterium]|nr:MAG: hypothetical protein ACD_46C00585G0003 [uncultured bacterium]